jgi:hypothetical protein
MNVIYMDRIIASVKLRPPQYEVNYAASRRTCIDDVDLDCELDATVESWRRDRRQYDAEITSWADLPADQCPRAVIVDIEDRQIGGHRVHHAHGVSREGVPRICINALSVEEVADYVAASFRYAEVMGVAPAEIAAGFRRLWSKLSGDAWAIRQRIGPERAPFEIACRPWWARRLRFAWFGIGHWDDPAPSKPISRVLARWFGTPAAALLLNDDDYDAFEFIGWVRRGWRPSRLLIADASRDRATAIVAWLDGGAAAPASPLRRQAEALWLAVHFERREARLMPRGTPARDADLWGLL